jgi:flavin-dependent dehydrogenase
MNIVIVGGGTAGWIAAYFISKSQPKMHNITVVESSKIGIIGAGEGSTGALPDILNGVHFNYKVDMQKFFEKTDATPKMGIKHKFWNNKKTSYFAPLDYSNTGYNTEDLIFKYVLANKGPQGIHMASPIGLLYDYGMHDSVFALHFDGHKVGQFFKEIVTIEDNVKHIDSVIKNVSLKANGDIDHITTEYGVKVYADLFIDCTGFARVLMKSVESKWISKKDILPMNTGLPFLLKYETGEKLLPETTATALSAGWMWDIPLQTRRGCGYVFDSSFISPDQAKDEVEKFLGKEIEPIKVINFEAGYNEYFWKNNVLSLGLASGFVEPLEATSIHNTIFQLIYFVKECLDRSTEITFIESKRKMYNERITKLNEYTVDFISLHYQGGRDDSEFWKHVKNSKLITEKAHNILEQSKGKIIGMLSFEGMYGSYSAPLVNWILAGMEVITKEQAKTDLIQSNQYDYAKQKYLQYRNSLKELVPYEYNT